MHFKAIIFDCDGVLVDSEPLAAQSLAEALTCHGLSLSRDEVYARFLGRSFHVVEDVFKRDTGRALATSFRRQWHDSLFALFKQRLRPIDGIEAILRALPLPYAVASSSAPDRLALSLSLTRLEPYFTGRILDASMVARGKPAPDLFLLAAERLAVAPADVLVIEDSRSGIEAACAAGMTAWAFTGGGHFATGRTGAELLSAGAALDFADMKDLIGLLAGPEQRAESLDR